MDRDKELMYFVVETLSNQNTHCNLLQEKMIELHKDTHIMFNEVFEIYDMLIKSRKLQDRQRSSVVIELQNDYPLLMKFLQELVDLENNLVNSLREVDIVLANTKNTFKRLAQDGKELCNQ